MLDALIVSHDRSEGGLRAFGANPPYAENATVMKSETTARFI
jgi:hypothetical protein